MSSISRRGLLCAVSPLMLTGLSGCSFLSGNSPSSEATPEYERLRNTATYVGDDVDLRLPDAVPRVEASTNADLIVIQGTPDVSVETAVSWLADDRVLALLGDRAEETWLEWARSEEFRSAFDTGGVGDADPDPQLLVGATIGVRVTTYRKTWGDQPSNSDIAAALDETMDDILTRRAEEND